MFFSSHNLWVYWYYSDPLSSGNFIVIGSTSACVIALTWAGSTYPWKSVHVLVPLIVGVIGLFMFMMYETKWAHHPIVCSITLPLPYQ